MIQLWAIVPPTGMLKTLPASVLLVSLQPPMYAARDAESPPSMPCARLRPNSMTVPSPAAEHTRMALVAISVWKLMVFRRRLSISCASMSLVCTRTRGSPGKTVVPSSGA